jgi:S-adenosylmethionine:tRNA ribosyltransferase-isomerase
MRTTDFDFYLPDALIAQHPVEKRSDSRLLCLDGTSGQLLDDQFKNLLSHITANDIIIFNDTRVIKARLFGRKSTGGAIELMIERILNSHEALTQIKSSRSPKAGAILTLADSIQAEVLGRENDLFHIRFRHQSDVFTILEEHGHLPLPPYIQHQADTEDETRYQTVFAKHLGAVAAPTAGLHFDQSMLDKIHASGVSIAYITLHVGAGTFQPVKVAHIEDHKMHSEHYHIPQTTVEMIERTRANHGNVFAVGTTALRALESAALSGKLQSGHNETNIFITPGFEFKVVDKLLTNFHLPKSTLLMLVSAFAGYDNVRAAYQHAVAQSYRFFSYGDAMLISRKQD